MTSISEIGLPSLANFKATVRLDFFEWGRKNSSDAPLILIQARDHLFFERARDRDEIRLETESSCRSL